MKLRWVFGLALLWRGAFAWHTAGVIGSRAGRRGGRPTLADGIVVDQANYDPEKSGLGTLDTSSRPEGSHSTGYRFMPMTSMANEPSPALVAIAGVYPGLTGADLAAPSPLPFPETGKWNYHRLTEGGCPSGFVCLPSTLVLEDCPDTVAVVCNSPTLGIELPDGNEHEVLALIDRSDPAVFDPAAFDSQTFYAIADTEDKVHIRWMQALPAGWRVVGCLLYTQLPFVKKPGSGGGFAELSDDFEF